MTTLQDALKVFEASEANLSKLEDLWGRIRGLIPDHPAFGTPPKYEEACFAFRRILTFLPAIDAFRVDDLLLDFDEIGQMRVDAIDIDDIEIDIRNSQTIEEPGRQLRKYRLKFESKR